MSEFTVTVIDTRDCPTRRSSNLAMHDALASGVVESAPPEPTLRAVIAEDGVPIARTAGSSYQLCDRRASAHRALTADEESLPDCDLDCGYGYFAGGRLLLPDGRPLAIGHELRII